jgi:hypothetical protein
LLGNFDLFAELNGFLLIIDSRYTDYYLSREVVDGWFSKTISSSGGSQRCDSILCCHFSSVAGELTLAALYHAFLELPLQIRFSNLDLHKPLLLLGSMMA